jgi:uncharacterized protein
MKCVYVYNKIDVIGIDDVDKLARQPSSVVISCNLKVLLFQFSNFIFNLTILKCSFINNYTFVLQLNLDRLLARMWEEMGLVRVYTKPQGQQPDFTDPVVLSTVIFIPLSCILHVSFA